MSHVKAVSALQFLNSISTDHHWKINNFSQMEIHGWINSEIIVAQSCISKAESFNPREFSKATSFQSIWNVWLIFKRLESVRIWNRGLGRGAFGCEVRPSTYSPGVPSSSHGRCTPTPPPSVSRRHSTPQHWRNGRPARRNAISFHCVYDGNRIALKREGWLFLVS